jgi:hypothetical protein
VVSDEDEDATLVLTDERDEDGTRWRAVKLLDDGKLAVVGHDLGPGVQRFFGCREYEFQRTLVDEDVAHLRALLGVSPDDDLLAAVARTFADTTELEAFLVDNHIPGTLWNRLGD